MRSSPERLGQVELGRDGFETLGDLLALVRVEGGAGVVGVLCVM